MHPLMLHELAKIKIAEEIEYAERQRRYRAATQHGTRSIDFSRLASRVRVILARRASDNPAPAGA